METPYYIYDEDQIRQNIQFLKKTFADCGAEIFFAVKANTSISILKIIKKQGIGAEVVSPGEIYLCRKAGFVGTKILYNNIARKESDVSYAIKKGVKFYNFEALDQAQLLERCAKKFKKKINLFVRVNPGIFPKTHPHLSTGSPISKFGIEEKGLKQVVKLTEKFRYAKLVGIHSHIGSQILSPKPFVKATRKVMKLIDILKKRGVDIKYVNLGGGFGIPYHPDDHVLDFEPIVKSYKRLADKHNVKIFLEPGRSVVGNAGYIMTKVISFKKRMKKPLYIVDAGMSENPRPAIYQAYHHIEPIYNRHGRKVKSRVAGPLCENSDEFGEYRLPNLKLGDLLMIQNCGAYTRTMVSNYNGRLLAPEYSVKKKKIRKIRKKQKLSRLTQDERY